MRLNAVRYVHVCMLALCLAAGARLEAGPTRTSRLGLGLSLNGALWPPLGGVGGSLSGKYWFDGVNAIDFGLGGNQAGVSVGADYLWHTAKAFNRRDIPLYFGLGGYLNLYGGYVGAGIQGKIGVDWLFPRTPWEVFVEGVPALNILGGFGFGAGLGGGFRYYF
jgi:hypothetical protein